MVDPCRHLHGDRRGELRHDRPVSAGGLSRSAIPRIDCPEEGDHGLQDCIDSLASGSTIILVDEIIDESASITKGLTLRALDRSLQPVLLPSASISTSARQLHSM